MLESCLTHCRNALRIIPFRIHFVLPDSVNKSHRKDKLIYEAYCNQLRLRIICITLGVLMPVRCIRYTHLVLVSFPPRANTTCNVQNYTKCMYANFELHDTHTLIISGPTQYVYTPRGQRIPAQCNTTCKCQVCFHPLLYYTYLYRKDDRRSYMYVVYNIIPTTGINECLSVIRVGTVCTFYTFLIFFVSGFLQRDYFNFGKGFYKMGTPNNTGSTGTLYII